MWEFIKHKLSKLGCFAIIALVAVIATGITRKILGLLDYSEQTKEEMGRQVGDYVINGFLGAVLILGFIIVIIRLKAEINSGNAFPTFLPKKSPPHIPQPPPIPATYQKPNPFVSGPIALDTRPASKKSKNGCLIVISSLVILLCLAIGGCWILAEQYEKRPKLPGEAEIFQAEEFIRSFETEEFDGNTPEAKVMAKDFARALRVTRETLIAASKPELLDHTKGRFLTYCHLKDDSAVFIVHVPGLSNFRSEAKLTLEETAWTLATTLIERDQPKLKHMALGIKGILDYSSIVTGTVELREPLKGIGTRHPLITTKPLWPYFTPDDPVTSKP